MSKVTIHNVAKAIEHDTSSAFQRIHALDNMLSREAWAKPLWGHVECLKHSLEGSLNSIMEIRDHLKDIPDPTITAQRLIDDLMKLIPFVQSHESLFDDLNTNFSLDEMLTIAAQRIKEHADMTFAKELSEKLR